MPAATDMRATSRRRGISSSLQWYLALPVLFFVVVAIAGSIYIFLDFRRTSIDDAIEDANFAAEGAASELDEGLELLWGTVNTVAQTPGLAALFEQPAANEPSDCTLNFGGPGIARGSLNVFRDDGVLACSSYVPSPETQAPVLEPEWIRQALTAPFLLAPASDPVTGAPIMVTAVPVPGGRGIVATIVYLDAVGETLTAQYVGASELEVLFVSDVGEVVYRSVAPERSIGRSFSGPPPDSEGGSEAADLDGRVRLYSSSPVGDTGWTVLVGADKEKALAASNRVFLREGTIITLALLALIATSLLTYWRITRRIQQLASAVRATTDRIAGGASNLSMAVPRGKDEIGDLGRAFEEMSAAIHAREREIDELNQSLERRVEARTAELEAANRELESFSYTVSHDLRAPLRAIDGFSAMLHEQHAAQLPATGTRYLDRIRAGTSRMGDLIDDLLQFSRVSRAELVKRSVSLDAIVQEAVEDVKSEIGARHVEWRLGDLGTAEADAGLLRRVVANLVGNAVKFSRNRDPAIIEIGRRDSTPPAYYVRDNGVGFDMAHAAGIFGVFQRLHLQEEFEGTGAGLAIVERIVTRHGGRVWAEAEPDRGATLYFTLEGPADDARETADRAS